MLKDLLSLFFPSLCLGCGNPLHKGENVLCLDCLIHLPTTEFSGKKDNVVARRFWGKIPVYAAGSYLWFDKGGKVQRLLHALKYKGDKNIGVLLGQMYGCVLKNTALFSSCEVIVPVPLHTSRLKRRGYNQSEQFARGLSEAMGIPFENALVKHRATSTQTQKTRYERWVNTNATFELNSSCALGGKHVLLVDDVITSGATLEACASTLFRAPGITISIATIACAR